MKIRAKANGNILDVSDGEAEALIVAGIYELAEENKMAPKTPKPSSTKVEPMTTKDIPQTPAKPTKGK